MTVGGTTPPERSPASPFFSRAYGSYTRQHSEALAQLYPPGKPKRLLDPFCGIGGALPKLAHAGHVITACDLNPVAVAFVELRRPEYLGITDRLIEAFEAVLSSCATPKLVSAATFEEGWLPGTTEEWLSEYGRVAAALQLPKPIREMIGRGLRFLPLLAARELTTFSSSDNAAWLKAGGLARARDPRRALRRALGEWIAYLRETYERHDGLGAILPSVADVRTLKHQPRFDGVFFSPPYANRLDYMRMWTPEAAVLRAVTGVDAFAAATHQIGTNVVRGLRLVPKDARALPRSAKAALAAIRADSAKASATYYYPFFLNYALSLHSAISTAAGLLEKGGMGVIFVRDTPRKDVLFPTADIAASALTLAGCSVKKTAHVIRHHIGMRRRAGHKSVQGLAQLEWWVYFERH